MVAGSDHGLRQGWSNRPLVDVRGPPAKDSNGDDSPYGPAQAGVVRGVDRRVANRPGAANFAFRVRPRRHLVFDLPRSSRAVRVSGWPGRAARIPRETALLADRRR